MRTRMNVLAATHPYDPRFFALVRILLGAYLLYYFIALMPHAGALYATGGIMPPADANPLISLVPFLAFSLSTVGAQILLGLLACSALAFLVGLWRVPAALLIVLGAAVLFIRNPLTEDPSMAFVNLLLILTALVPTGEGWSLPKRSADSAWYMPRMVYAGAWAVLAIAYSASGIDRLLAPSWQDGSALHHLFTLVTAFDTQLTHFLQSLSPAVTAFLTYDASIAFLLAVPLILCARTRPFAWLLYMVMFAFIGLVIDLTQVILGILLYQLFLFDREWVRTGPFARPYRALVRMWQRV